MVVTIFVVTWKPNDHRSSWLPDISGYGLCHMCISMEKRSKLWVLSLDVRI